jgi:hypothetical protein
MKAAKPILEPQRPPGRFDPAEVIEGLLSGPSQAIVDCPAQVERRQS